jgi:hypothetical protein
MWLADMGLSEHSGSGWQGQLARVARWHERVQGLGSRDDLMISPITAFDYLYAFFQNCYHLRDWLKNSGALSESDLQRFMTDNMAMAVCRDIANGTKHLKITSPTMDANPAFGREYHPPRWPGKRPGTSESYFVLIEDPANGTVSRFDLQDLAGRCLAEWEVLLRAKGLLKQ